MKKWPFFSFQIKMFKKNHKIKAGKICMTMEEWNWEDDLMQIKIQMVHKIEITIKKGMYVKMVSIAQG